MRNFRSDSRSRSSSRPRGGFSGRSNGGYGGRSEGRGRFGRDRDSGMSERRPREMHEVTCDKCGKQCQVPFRPSGDKPVLCSDCFRNNNGSNNNFGSRNQDKSVQSGISSEQFNQLNAKLDKIILVLQDLELDVGDKEEDIEDEEDDSEEDSEDEDEEDSKDGSN